MKNITITIDEETHRRARIRAAELGTSVSALVKDYLRGLDAEARPPVGGVREMQASYKQAEAAKDGPPWLVDGQWVYTRNGKPRQPGAMRGKFKQVILEELETPDWLIDIMEGSQDDLSDLLPFDEAQLPK